MEVLPWPQDEPSRVLTWESGGLQRSLRLLIKDTPDNYELKIFASCWRDDVVNNERIRYYFHKELEPIFIGGAERAAEKQREIYDRLSRAFQTSSSLTIAELEERENLGKVTQIL